MADFKELSREELKQKMDEGDDFVLVDVLGLDSYNNAHLPGAEMVDAHQSKEEFLADMEGVVGDKSQEVVVYCANFSCQLSPKAAGWLAEAGYENVYDFEGGLEDWAKGGYSFEGENAEETAENLRSQ